MDTINSFFTIDFPALFLSVFMAISGIKAILSSLEWLAAKCGIESKWLRRKQEDRQLLLDTAQNLNTLRVQHEQDIRKALCHDAGIRQDLEKLTAMFIDKAVDDMRWEIITFAAKISTAGESGTDSGLSKESYQHCLHIYEKYEKMIEENGLTNGEVELSMEIIHQSYKEKLKNGFYTNT